MKKSTLNAVLILLLFIKQNTQAQTGYYVQELANFDTAMLNLLYQYDIPGGQLAITYHGCLVYSRGFGYADTTIHTPVCPDNIFRLASCSKTITSITMMHLYEQGRVHLEDTVFGANGILNDTIYQNIIDTLVYNITVRELLTHSGGWDRNISGDPLFNTYSIAQTMSVTPPADAVTVIRYTLSRQMLDFTPGTQFQYSNLGYCILGRVIEKITGQSYENYVRDTILAPLNITDMHCGFNLLADQLPSEVNYYDYPGAPYANSVYDSVTLVPGPYGGFNLEAVDAPGGWVASAQDVCKLLTAVDRFPTRPDILLPATIDTMVHPSINNPNYAFGWQILNGNNWWHQGGIPGSNSELYRANSELNFTILLNSYPYNSGTFTGSVVGLFWNVLPTITSWPAFDLFDSTYNCINTSVKDIDESSTVLTIFPNPSNGKFTIKNDGFQLANSKLEIYNSFGEIIYSKFGSRRQTVINIDISNFSKGLYFVKVYDGTNIYTRKIILQ